jgi:PAS domain S-box-containing protein
VVSLVDPQEELASLRARVAQLEREARTARMASEELTLRMLQAIPCGIVHVRVDGSIMVANDEALRILGHSYDALTKRYMRDFDTETVREDGTPCTSAEYPVTRALVTGAAQPPMTIGVRRPDGRISWAVFTAVPVKDPSSGKVTSAIVTFLDVTERRAREAAAREQQAMLLSVLSSAPNPIAYTDARGNIRFLNRGGPSFTVEQVVGRPAWDFVDEADRANFRTKLLEVVATGERQRLELRAIGRFYVLHIGPVLEGDRCVGASIISWDVTEQRALEANAMISDRMAAIGTMTAGIAHEINNPLTYLLANLELLERLATTEQGRRSLAAAKEGASRIRSIVSDLSTFSRVGEERRVVVDVHDLIDSALRMAESTTRPRARIVRSYGAVAPVLASDARLAQVFLNLIVNAAHAIGDGDPSSDRIEISTTMVGKKVVVEVRDTGRGIAPELLPRLFDPFVTTKPVGSGTGLGLYICRNVVTALGGTIEAENAPEGGALFRVSLPAAGVPPSVPPPPMPAPAPPEPVEKPKLRILAVDDEPSILAIVSAFLHAHAVKVAHGGKDALALLEEEEFDVVLCDLVMPEVTGMDLYEQLERRGRGGERRIVFITGGAVTARARAFLDAVPNTVLAKPFGPEELLAVVLEVGRQ